MATFILPNVLEYVVQTNEKLTWLPILLVMIIKSLVFVVVNDENVNYLASSVMKVGGGGGGGRGRGKCVCWWRVRVSGGVPMFIDLRRPEGVHWVEVILGSFVR